MIGYDSAGVGKLFFSVKCQIANISALTTTQSLLKRNSAIVA